MKKNAFYTSAAGVVRRLREERNLSQLELSRLSGMSAAQLCKIERGNSELTSSTMRRIAAALGVPVSVLLGEAVPGPAAAIVADCDRAGSEILGCDDFVPVLSSSAGDKAALGELVKIEKHLAAEEERLGIDGQTALQLVYAYGGDERSAELLARDVRTSLGMGSQPRTDLEPVLESVGVRVMKIRRPAAFQSASFYNAIRRTLSIALNSSNTDTDRKRWRVGDEG